MIYRSLPMKLLPVAALLALVGMARAELLVSGFSSNAVYRYDEATGTLGTAPFITTGSGQSLLSQPHRVLMAPDGNLLVASAGNNRVLRYNGSTGAFLDAFIPGGSGTLSYPVDMTLGPGGLLYVSSQGSDAILRYNATTGAFVDTFVSSGEGGLDGPSGLVFLNGDLYVAGRYSNKIHRYDANGDPVGTGVFDSFGSSVFGLEIGLDNRLYAVTGQSVLRYDPPVTGATETTFVSAGSGGLNGAIGLDFGPDGDLYLTSFNTNSVIEYDGDTGGSPATYATAGSSGLSGPNFLTFRPVPEPSSAAFGVIGLAMLLRRSRLRRIAA